MPFFSGGSGSSGGGSGGFPTLSGSGAPSSSLGVEGQLYIDTASSVLYGPKSASGWGSGIPLVTTPWANVTDKPSTFQPTAHAHIIADVTGLQASLDGKAASSHQHAIADINNLQATLNAKAASSHQHVIADTTGLQSALDGKQAAGSYATLVNGVVPTSQLPGFVDDVVEVSSLPTSGETGKIYINTTSGKVFRWSGSTFVEIVGSPGSTDAVPEGSTNLYFTNARATAAVQSQIDGKAALSHTHTVSAVTGLQALLDAKAAATHTHSIAEISTLEDRLNLASTSLTPPATDTSSGTPGQLALDSTYLYGCIAANTWRRIEWAAFGSAAGGITIASQPSDQTASASSGSPSLSSMTNELTNSSYLSSFFHSNGTLWAGSSTSWNRVYSRASGGSWQPHLLSGTDEQQAASSFNETFYPDPYDYTLVANRNGPIQHICGTSSFVSFLREDMVADSAVWYRPSSGSSFLTGGIAGSNTAALLGVTAVASNSQICVAALAKGVVQTTYSYTNVMRYFDTYALAYTLNGGTWTQFVLDDYSAINAMTHTGSRFVAVGFTIGNNAASWYSTNGLSWTKSAMPTGMWMSVAAGNGKVVAVGAGYVFGYTDQTWWRARWGGEPGTPTRMVAVSADGGAGWTAYANALPMNETWCKVVFVGGSVNRFVAFSTSSSVCAISADGITWDTVFRGDAASYGGSHATVGDALYIANGGYGYGQASDAFSVSVSSGGTGSATFTISATTTVGSLAYQWQKSSNGGASYLDIAAATTATLSLSGLTSADNNSKYRCKLTAGSATVYSNAATLTVAP